MTLATCQSKIQGSIFVLMSTSSFVKEPEITSLIDNLTIHSRVKLFLNISIFNSVVETFIGINISKMKGAVWSMESIMAFALVLTLPTFTVEGKLSYRNAKSVHLDLYYESLCPDCSGFIQDQLLPSWNRLQNSGIFTLSLYPYGNARETKLDNGTYIYKCQHGEDECFGNLVEACIIKQKRFEAKEYLPVIGCIEKSVRNGSSVKSAIKTCIIDHEGEKSLAWIMECALGPEGQRLMHKIATKTNALIPSHTFVPWIVFNGIYSEEKQNEAEENLTKLICELYKGHTPDECQYTIS